MEKNEYPVNKEEETVVNLAETKPIMIEFLYIDLDTSERCMEAESNLDDAVDELEIELKSKGYELAVVKVEITTKELAEEFLLEYSPTIRVNGYDILGEVLPKAIIIAGILKAIHSEPKMETEKVYVMPENIAGFFKGKEKKGCGCSCGGGGCSAQ